MGDLHKTTTWQEHEGGPDWRQNDVVSPTLRTATLCLSLMSFNDLASSSRKYAKIDTRRRIIQSLTRLPDDPGYMLRRLNQSSDVSRADYRGYRSYRPRISSALGSFESRTFTDGSITVFTSIPEGIGSTPPTSQTGHDTPESLTPPSDPVLLQPRHFNPDQFSTVDGYAGGVRHGRRRWLASSPSNFTGTPMKRPGWIYHIEGESQRSAPADYLSTVVACWKLAKTLPDCVVTGWLVGWSATMAKRLGLVWFTISWEADGMGKEDE
ncbi:hypothetical protein CHU98_g10902 [Xylaria longipes]|nr:hypothetical protein CHU98_g10902 [Xylaria longipes]